MVVGGFLTFYFIVGVIGFVRDAWNPDRSLSNVDLPNAWLTFVRGSNIITTTAAYIRWTPVFGFEWGKNLLQIFIYPIPSVLWLDKYKFIGESPMDVYKGNTGAAAAFFIEFYVSFGPAGVVLGMAVLGWLCRRVYDQYKANPENPLVQMSLALLWSFLFHLYGRNLLALLVYGMLYLFAPIWVSRWLVSKYGRIKKEFKLQTKFLKFRQEKF
jgi:hypothetical protein